MGWAERTRAGSQQGQGQEGPAHSSWPRLQRAGAVTHICPTPLLSSGWGKPGDSVRPGRQRALPRAAKKPMSREPCWPGLGCPTTCDTGRGKGSRNA